jgi:tetratricopeptide (TPR) repeat protein
MTTLIRFTIVIIMTVILTGSIYKIDVDTKPVKFETVNLKEVLFSCSYVNNISDDDCIPDNIGSFTSDNISVAIILKKILGCLNEDSTKKITANFLTYECTFPEPVFKALTKKSDSTRYILYTKKQLDQLVNVNTDWVAYSIFAHEIAHHLYGHSLSNPKSDELSRKRELQADFFSGYVLHKLNANLLQAQSGINSVTKHPAEDLEEYCSHPTKAKRLNAVSMGFDYQTSPQATTFQLLNTDSLSRQQGLEQIFNKSFELFIDRDIKKALEMFEQILPYISKKNKIVAEYYNNKGVLKNELGDINGAIKDFNKAIILNDQQADYFLNRGKTKEKSSQKVLKAESIEDIKKSQEIYKFQSSINL